jgi:hypothetical protein
MPNKLRAKIMPQRIPVFCEKCGTKFEDPISFCNKCGNELAFVPYYPPAEKPIEIDYSGLKSCLSTLVFWCIIAALAVGLLYLIVRFIRWAWETPIPLS